MGNGYFAPRFHRFLLQSNDMSLKKATLCFFNWHSTGGSFDASPGSNQFVIRSGILGPALAFAECVKTVGKLADCFGFALHGSQQSPCAALASVLQRANELMECFPHRRRAWRSAGPSRQSILTIYGGVQRRRRI